MLSSLEPVAWWGRVCCCSVFLTQVARIVVVGRSTALGRFAVAGAHAKLEEHLTENLFDLSPIVETLTGLDACFFCLGVSSAGMAEADYRRITYDLTLSIASLLARQNLQITFVYVSGASTDSTERGRMM